MAITSVRTSSISNPQRFQSLAQATYVAPVPSTVGMVLLTPTSITYSGTSASVGANGQVTFSAVTSLSLNGVFGAGFDNYVIAMQMSCSGNDTFYYRMRLSGADNSTASSYVSQQLYAGGTTVAAGRQTQNYGLVSYISSTARNGLLLNIYGPAIAQPTALRSVSVSGYSSAYIDEQASTHNQSTAYDGITLYPGSTNMTGTLTVMGVRS